MTVEFYQNQFFKVNSTGTDLQSDVFIQKNFTVFKELPKQLANRKLGALITEGVKIMKKTVANSLIVMSSINVLFLAGISLIWSLINSLELILYLPLIDVSFPALVVMIYSVLIPISTLDIVPDDFTLHIFNLSADIKNNNSS